MDIASVGMSRDEEQVDEDSRSTNVGQDQNDMDVSFLLDIRKAIIAEDHRIGEILKKKERFFVTF